MKKCLEARAKELLSGELIQRRGRAFVWRAEEVSKVRTLREGSVDLILTSPPYLNVQTYAKDSWLRLWLLGHDYRDLRPSFIETGSPRVYVEKMKPCLQEMLKVLKAEGRAVIIAGDAPCTVKKKKRFFRTAEGLALTALELRRNGYRFIVEERITDGIPAHARYYAAVHKDGKAGRDARKGVRLERIVVLRKVKGNARPRAGPPHFDPSVFLRASPPGVG